MSNWHHMLAGECSKETSVLWISPQLKIKRDHKGEEHLDLSHETSSWDFPRWNVNSALFWHCQLLIGWNNYMYWILQLSDVYSKIHLYVKKISLTAFDFNDLLMSNLLFVIYFMAFCSSRIPHCGVVNCYLKSNRCSVMTASGFSGQLNKGVLEMGLHCCVIVQSLSNKGFCWKLGKYCALH